MADVGELFALCRTFEKDLLLGIEKHHGKGHVLLTFKERGVLVYDLETRKLVYSLPVQQRKQFTSPVVQDPQTKKYIGVLDDVNVCQWAEDAPNLDDCQQKQVEHPVAEILLDSLPTSEHVVVFRDGSCNLLSKCSAKTKRTTRKSTMAPSRNITSSILHHNNTSIVAVATFKEKQLGISLSKVIGGDLQFMGEWNVDPPDKNVNVKSCCFQASSTNLISYWSNGSLCVTELKDLLNSFLPGEFQSQNSIHLECRCISKQQENSSTKNPVSIATLGPTHICICSTNKTKTGLEETLFIYDTKFGTQQASLSFEKLTEDTSISSKQSGSHAHHILSTDGYICTNVKQCIAVCSVTVKESSLASALGKLSSSTRSAEMTSIKPLLCIPQLPDPSKDWKDWVKSTNTSEIAEDEILMLLSNPEKTKTVKAFNKKLNDYLEAKCLQKGKDEGYHEDGVSKRYLKAKDKWKSKYKLSQHFVLTVLSRCLEETKFFPKEALTNLIKTRCIPGSSSPDLLKYLTEKNQLGMIILCLKNIQAIPETSIVSCIEYAIQADSSVFEDEETTEDKEADSSEIETPEIHYLCPFGKKRSNLLCHLLSYPVNDLFLQESIKHLTDSSVVALMKFLAHVIHTATRNSFERTDSALEYAMALDWAGWLINTHYASFVLMTDIHSLLEEMQRLVGDQVQLFDKLIHLDGYLAHFKYKQQLPSNQNPGLYTVEMIEL